jgi:hypothetical protein
MPHSHGSFHHVADDFAWADKFEALMWAHAQLQRNGI